jgi:hypothetical protein
MENRQGATREHLLIPKTDNQGKTMSTNLGEHKIQTVRTNWRMKKSKKRARKAQTGC